MTDRSASGFTGLSLFGLCSREPGRPRLNQHHGGLLGGPRGRTRVRVPSTRGQGTKSLMKHSTFNEAQRASSGDPANLRTLKSTAREEVPARVRCSAVSVHLDAAVPSAMSFLWRSALWGFALALRVTRGRRLL